MNYANSGNFTCVWQHQISQLSSASLYQTLSRSFKDPLQALTWALGNFSTDNSDRETTAGAHSDQGYSLGKTKKSSHTPPMSCILCLKTKTKKRQKKIKKEQKNKKAETNKKKCKWFFYQTAKHPLASHATSRFPMLYIYMCSGWQALLAGGSLCMF